MAAAVTLATGWNATAQAQGFGPPRDRRFAERPSGREYRFGARAYTAELAQDLAREANAICVELDRNYRDNRGYRETYRDAYMLITDSKHIQQLIREGYLRQSRRNDDHIERDLRDLDRLFHSVERDVRNWNVDRRAPGRQDRATLVRLMNDFDRTLNLLMTDYGVRDTTYDRRGRDDRRDDRRDDFRR
ncbi:MAG: hypothetical protein IT428_28125 [Planctomycetaceae bacterium]|nr:hypothetical protein [Planctomycetaceae bacterium]